MQLRARLLVEGFIAGLHKSPYHGFSVEFSQHRQYIPGDPLKNIDWRVYGRTDKFFVKQFEEETNLKAYILLDCSASMGYSSGKNITKLEYSSYLTAALTYLLLSQRDAVGLITFDQSIRSYLPPRSIQGYMSRIMSELTDIQPGGKTGIGETLHLIAERIKRRGLVIVISDLFDEENSILMGLKHFRHYHHEVLVFHILDPIEKSFALQGNLRLKDLETNDRLPVLPEHVRIDYQREFKKYLNIIENGCVNHKIDYSFFDTSKSFDTALFRYINKRKRMR
ncbi:DUF58 domain-containing protein [bacterium]|nr:DUF58 domain-containing protein [bacterium]